jgi:hypothetical protein
MDAKKLRSIISALLSSIILLFLFTNGYPVSGSGSNAAAQVPSSPTVTLRAASGASILFKPQKEQLVEGVSPKGWDVPHLVLRRNSALTDPEERTLVAEVTGIKVPPPGVTVTLSVETQHGDPDPVEESASEQAKEPRLSFRARGYDRRILVWSEARWIANASGTIQIGAKAIFKHTFDETVISGAKTIATPTDYFRYDLTVINPSHLPTDALDTSSDAHAVFLHLRGEYALLMENQSIVPLPEVWEASPDAAPDELIVYYADMFPFQKDVRDPTTWLAREDVPRYVHTELVPRMVEAFRIQTDEWGFPWYEAWDSYRPGLDDERLSVALSDGRTWFHGRAPKRSHSGISINVAGGDNEAYDTLTDGLMSSFHHELFHNHQRNISRHQGNTETVAGVAGAWKFFSEGTAVLASAVGQPHRQFASTSRAYISRANNFIGGYGYIGDLNTGYDRLFPYNAAIYWRFLYEQCGTGPDGSLDPAAGMEVIRSALNILYSGEVVDVAASTDLVAALPEIIDRALAGSECPFDTHAESITAFARALYGLRFERGRCVEPGSPSGCGFYDPHNLYHDPPIETVSYSGADQQHAGAIPSSFGIDFVNVTLGQAADGDSLALEFHAPPGAAAEFTVQVLELKSLEKGWRLQVVSTQRASQGILRTTASDREFSYLIPAVDTTEYDALGLVITRLDANERVDPVGEYTIVVRLAESDAQLAALPSR